MCRNDRLRTDPFLHPVGRLIAAPTRYVTTNAVGADSIRPRTGTTGCVQTTVRDCHGRRRPRNDKWVCLSVIARRLRRGNPLKELRTTYKPVHLHRLPLRGRHAEVVVPYDHGTHPTVGRDDSARRCRNYRVRTSSFIVPSAAVRSAGTCPRPTEVGQFMIEIEWSAAMQPICSEIP